MRGQKAPENWKGKIEGVEYNLGPEMETGFKIRLKTHNYLERAQSYNVFGAIKGNLEPGKISAMQIKMYFYSVAFSPNCNLYLIILFNSLLQYFF